MHDFEIVYQTLFFIRGILRIQLVPFNACTHPAAWFCGNAHPFGWLDFAFVETPIPLDGLICILTNFLVENMTLIIEDGPEIPKSSQEDPWKDSYKGTWFLRFSARNRSILEDGPNAA